MPATIVTLPLEFVAVQSPVACAPGELSVQLAIVLVDAVQSTCPSGADIAVSVMPVRVPDSVNLKPSRTEAMSTTVPVLARAKVKVLGALKSKVAVAD